MKVVVVVTLSLKVKFVVKGTENLIPNLRIFYKFTERTSSTPSCHTANTAS